MELSAIPNWAVQDSRSPLLTLERLVSNLAVIFATRPSLFTLIESRYSVYKSLVTSIGAESPISKFGWISVPFICHSKKLTFSPLHVNSTGDILGHTFCPEVISAELV